MASHRKGKDKSEVNKLAIKYLSAKRRLKLLNPLDLSLDLDPVRTIPHQVLLQVGIVNKELNLLRALVELDWRKKRSKYYKPK